MDSLPRSTPAQKKEVLRLSRCKRVWRKNETCVSWFNPFSVLLLDLEELGASWKPEVQKQYYRISVLVHPDKNPHPEADSAFTVLSSAYHYLKDPVWSQKFYIAETSAKQEVEALFQKRKSNNESKRDDLLEEKIEEKMVQIFINIEAKAAKTSKADEPNTPIILVPPPEVIHLPASVPSEPITEEIEDQQEIPTAKPLISTDPISMAEPTKDGIDPPSEVVDAITVSTQSQIILVETELQQEKRVVNKIATRGATHTKNQMPHKKDRHEKGFKQRNAQRVTAEKRLRKDGIAYTGKVKFINQELG